MQYLKFTAVNDAEINDVMVIHVQVCIPVLYNHDIIDSNITDRHEFVRLAYREMAVFIHFHDLRGSIWVHFVHRP